VALSEIIDLLMNKQTFNTNIVSIYIRYTIKPIAIILLICLILFITSIVIDDNYIFMLSLLFLVFSPFYMIISFINLLLKNNTKSLIIDASIITIYKRNKLNFHFNIIDIKTYKIVSKSWWWGFMFKNNNNKTSIWRYEFSKCDWKIISDYINDKCPPKETISYIFGQGFN